MSSRDFYEAAQSAAATHASREERCSAALSHARLAALILGIVALYLAERGTANRFAWFVAAGTAAVAFAALVATHARARTRLDLARARGIACRNGLARIARDWDNLPEPIIPALDAGQAVCANDLAVTGHASLATLLNVTTPSLGGSRVIQWLLSDPPPVDVIARRAESVRALRDMPRELLDVAASTWRRGRGMALGATDFARWASRPPEQPVLSRARIGAWACYLLTALAVLAIATLGGHPAIFLILGAQVAIAGAARVRLERDLKGVDDAFTESAAVARSLESAAALRQVPGRVGEIAKQLHDHRALHAMQSLRRLLDWNNTRYSPLGLWALDTAVGLDAHLWRGIVHWRARHGAKVVAWIDAAAELEAHVSLATLGFENPAWTMPVVREESGARGAVRGANEVRGVRCEVRGLTHPLLRPDIAVANELRLQTPGEVLVVSGSNMSGKTTYLRAAGLAALLAQAGGPVCATSMTLTRCRVRTSVRVEDDLSSGVSLFFAEARRLRDVVSAAREAGEAPVFFLLDEILHGTNAADRRTATQLVLSHLAQAGAFGIVTTHDPAIASAADTRARQVHFGESLAERGASDDGVGLSFDYTVRDGPATSANALAILRALGL